MYRLNLTLKIPLVRKVSKLYAKEVRRVFCPRKVIIKIETVTEDRIKEISITQLVD